MATGSLSQTLGKARPLVGDGSVTDLVVVGVTIPDFAARGLKVRISNIEQASRLERTVNATLINLSDPLFRKRKVMISGSDVEFPYFADVWPGDEVTVTSIIEANAGGDPIVIVGMIKDFEMERDEYEQVSSWTMEVWEI